MKADYKDLRIVFLGTPDFAVASLDILAQAGCNIVGVITAPDKPGGRGMELQQSAVKKYALGAGLHILQPANLKDPSFLQELRLLRADLQVVVAFRMLPQLVWEMPALGTVNVHGSLLPQYRGAAPINWAIINGEDVTGITTFKLQHQIDTGDILLQKEVPIDGVDTAGTLHDRMKMEGAALLLSTIKGLAANTLKEVPQASLTTRGAESPTHAPKIFTDTCMIDWTRNSTEIFNLVRGLSPSPAAFTYLHEKKLKVFFARPASATSAVPGTINTDKKTYLQIACNGCWMDLLEIQLEGKKRMNVTSFLAGYRFPE